jgi:hypothetical protein
LVPRLDGLRRQSLIHASPAAAFGLTAGRGGFFSRKIPMTNTTTKTARIRQLNDLARIRPENANATWLMTIGVRAVLAGDLPHDPAAKILDRTAALRRAIAAYADWSEDNDPHGEHDFGAFDFCGERLFFKIDYYHPDRDVHAPDPANIELCRRVLTLMLASEY